MGHSTTEESTAHGNMMAGTMSNRDWWPNQLILSILHQNSLQSNPMGEDFS